MAAELPSTNDDGDEVHDTLVVFLAGELDIAREDELLAILTGLDPRPDTTINLDVSNVSFVDSRGLYSILRARSYLQSRDCQLRLLRPQPQLVKVIEITGLTDVLVVADGDGAA